MKRHTNLAIAAIAILALLIGAAMPIYVDLMGQAKLAAFPALLVFAFLLLYDRKLTLMLIVLFRSSGDIFLEQTRFSLGGYQIGIGGLINACVILTALLLALEKPEVVSKNNIIAWAVFLSVALFGVLTAPVKSDAIRSWLSLLSYFAIFASAFYFIQTKEDFKFCVKIVLWSSIIPVLYAFIDIALNGSHVEGFRLQSTFSHPNEFSFYLTLVISLVFYMLKSVPIDERSGQRIFLALYFLLLLGLLILTKTRSAWLACFLGFALYALFFDRSYFLYLTVLAVVGVFIPGVAERLSDLGQGNEITVYAQLNSFAWRVYLWKSALQWTMPAQYIFGNGLQSFKEYSPIFFPLAGRVNWGAHSVYVQLIFELGLVGLGAYLYIYYGIFRELASMLKFDRLGAFFLIVVVINYLICAISDNMLDYLSFNWYVWFIVGAGCAFARVNTVATKLATP